MSVDRAYGETPEDLILFEAGKTGGIREDAAVGVTPLGWISVKLFEVSLDT